MDIKDFKNIIWKHYLVLEKEFDNTTDFVSLNSKNFNTFSDKYLSLLLLIGSEIDVVLKEICKILNVPNGNNVNNINDYRQVITESIPSILTDKVWVNYLCININPWGIWSNNFDTPNWWKSYNKTKHERISIIDGNHAYVQANLENVLYGLAALYLCDLYLFSLIINKEKSNNSFDISLAAIKPSYYFNIYTTDTNCGSTFIDSRISINGVEIPFQAF